LRVGADYYPAASRLAHEEGLCRVRVNVDATGSITESAIDTSSGYPRLDEACLNAVVGQHVLPATEDGRPVPATAILPINWKLAGPTAELPGSAPANEDRSANNLIERGAIAGTAQRVFFLYSVNGDCSSAGLAQVAVDKAPEHGKVSFAKISDYTDFPASNKNYACNHKGKVNGLAVVYTPSKDFSGKERFSVQGVWPKGGLFNFDFSIKVLQAQP
jgi:TonB family protein